jgi:hypothetical protein
VARRQLYLRIRVRQHADAAYEHSEESNPEEKEKNRLGRAILCVGRDSNPISTIFDTL